MGYIDPQFIEQVTDTADLLQVIGEFVELKKNGANYTGHSPFTEERTPSFTVSPVKGIWKCFSTGKGGSSVISFLMAMEKSYVEAVEYLAHRQGKSIRYSDEKLAKAYHEKREKKEGLRPVLMSTSRLYHKALLELPKTHRTWRELKRRGYSEDVVKNYGIGYAEGNRTLYDQLSANGRVADGLELALINIKNNDRYWDRLIYPIHDVTGEIIGLAGRDLSGNDKTAKWINSSDTLLYDKGTVWYALHLAKRSIAAEGCAYIVEGYNDVVSFRESGIPHTISNCGTAITARQIKILKRFCSKVVLAMDGDKAGRKAMLKYIPIFLKEDFTVHCVQFPEGQDPDEMARSSSREDLVKDLDAITKDGFKLLIDHHLQGTEVEKSMGAKKLADVMAGIGDDAKTEIYLKWVQKESGVKLSTLRDWIEGAQERKALERVLKERGRNRDAEEKYEFPEGIAPTEELVADADRYHIIQAKNQIWARTGEDQPYHFKSISNFSIEIIQHMVDEKWPSKLIQIVNVENKEVIFDVPSEALNTNQPFDNTVTSQGNYLFKGSRPELNKLRAYLFDKMGSGRKIEVLGWQEEGFWVWNNQIMVPGEGVKSIDGNGVFKKDKVSYYIPSSNIVYANNPYKFSPQKRFKVEPAATTFQDYTSRMVKVHREHAISALLFTVASMFQDVIVPQAKSFPLLFFYGPASTGKDMLAECCQAFFGRPQNAINLEGGNSTFTAQIRKTAQFCNGITHLSEYRRGDQKLNGTLKGFWDRRGKEIGNIESRVATDETPILSSIMLTGNEYPDDEALITRLIWNEMTKNVFSQEEEKAYNELADLTHKGISSFSNDIISLRPKIAETFKRNYREFRETMAARVPDARSRMIGNMSVLGGTYMTLKDDLGFPFDLASIIDSFKGQLDIQMRKLAANSRLTRWWDCFLASMRGQLTDQLRVNKDFCIEGESLFFNYTNAYSRVQRQWYVQYREPAPGKSTMRDLLKKDPSFVDDLKSKRMDTGRDATNTSAMEINLTMIENKAEILMAMDFQLQESGGLQGNISFPSAPATPSGKNSIGDNSKNSDDDELPF